MITDYPFVRSRLRKAQPQRARGEFPTPRAYLIQLSRQIVIYLIFFLILIEFIFIAEELMHVLELLFQLAGKEAYFSDVVFLLASRSPVIFGLALPTALLIAVYCTTLRSREDSEIVVLATMGVSVHQLVRRTVIIGLAAQIISLFTTGVVEPYTQFIERSIYFDAYFRALRSGSEVGQFYSLNNRTVFIFPHTKSASNKGLFIYENGIDNDYGSRVDIDSVITADQSTVEGLDDGGYLTIHLLRAMKYDFDRSKESETRSNSALKSQGLDNDFMCDDCRPAKPSNILRVEDLAKPLAQDELIHFDPRGQSPAEWTTLELLGVQPPLSAMSTQHVIEVGERISRSFLCLIAPFMAGLALAFTNRSNQVFVLPAACAILMGINVAASAVVKALAPMGPAVVLPTISIIALSLVALLMQQIMARQHAIVKPAMVTQ